jgi:hypothetical protein
VTRAPLKPTSGEVDAQAGVAAVQDATVVRLRTQV